MAKAYDQTLVMGDEQSFLLAQYCHLRQVLPFTCLDDFLGDNAIDALDAYLVHADIFGDDHSRTSFRAAGFTHAPAIELQTKHVELEFEACRHARGDPKVWHPNENYERLPDLVDFVARLPFFEHTGKVTVILSEPWAAGVEHVDHKFEDWVSEFVWLRTNRKKQFFVRDSSGTAHHVEGNCVFFDDHLVHCTSPCADFGFSIRVDGRFTPTFRAYIATRGYFAKQAFREVLMKQQRLRSGA